MPSPPSRSSTASTSSSSGPRPRSSPASPTPCAPPASPCSAPIRPPPPSRASKTFAKRIMDAAGVPTGRAVRAATVEEASAALDEFGAPYVVKADGLAAGKGVLVTSDRDAAVAHAAQWAPRGGVLIEEFLDGQEVSLFLLSDGEHVLPLSPAQDFKRLLDGDAGPEHRRHGRLLAAALARRRVRLGAGVRRRGHRDDRPAHRAPARRRGHALRRPALLRAHPHVEGHPRHRVQRPLRRPRDAGRAAPPRDAARRTAVRGRHRHARRARAPGLLRRRRGHRRASPARTTPSRPITGRILTGSRMPHPSTACTSPTRPPPTAPRAPMPRASSSPRAAACSASWPSVPTSARRAPAPTTPSAASGSRAAQFRTDIAAKVA